MGCVYTAYMSITEADLWSMCFQGGTFDRIKQRCGGDFDQAKQSKYVQGLPGLSDKQIAELLPADLTEAYPIDASHHDMPLQHRNYRTITCVVARITSHASHTTQY